MHSKIIIVGLVICSLTIVLGSCIKHHNTELVENKEIVLSLDEMLFYPEHLRDTTFRPKYKYIVYVDSAECSPCRLTHMGIWNYFRNELSDNNAEIYIILYSEKSIVDEIKQTHDLYKHRIPIYIDTLGVFERDNPQIAEMTTEYHNFLLDENNKIIVVGDASQNHHVRDRIFEILSRDADSTVTKR